MHRAGHVAVTERRAVLRELVRTNDIVLVSAIGALLDGANIHHLVLDQNMSIIEGGRVSRWAIAPAPTQIGSSRRP